MPTPAAARYSATGDPESAGADNQHASRFQPRLSLEAKLRQQRMPAVAEQFVRRKGHLRSVLTGQGQRSKVTSELTSDL